MQDERQFDASVKLGEAILEKDKWTDQVKFPFDPTVGNKFDSEKPRMDLLDADFLEGVAEVLTFGANKYAAHNWRNGIKYSRLIAAAYRHLGAINRGEDVDPESGLLHTWHLGCCVMFLSSMMTTRPELDDRWKGTTDYVNACRTERKDC